MVLLYGQPVGRGDPSVASRRTVISVLAYQLTWAAYNLEAIAVQWGLQAVLVLSPMGAVTSPWVTSRRLVEFRLRAKKDQIDAELIAACAAEVETIRERRLRGVRPAVQRLDPHPLHQRDRPAAADLRAVRPKQVAEHPAARERCLQVQLVQPAHHRQLGRGR